MSQPAPPPRCSRPTPVPPRTLKAPDPPAGTTPADYEWEVATWRIRITDLIVGLGARIERYEVAEAGRHKAILKAITAKSPWWQGGLKACGVGAIEVAKVLAGNENGQLKYLAAALVALAAIVQGVSFVSPFFSTGVLL